VQKLWEVDGVMDIIERAARALCKFEHGVEDYWLGYRPEAISVIKAMREPDEGMRNAAIGNNGVGPFTAEKVWQAMIDQALKGYQQ
jgi:hypothetical protein